MIALASDPSFAIVSLNNVIKTMKETAENMNNKYKETFLGGLAVNVGANVRECGGILIIHPCHRWGFNSTFTRLSVDFYQTITAV